MFRAQTLWIASHIEILNVKFAIHLGDVVETSSRAEEWRVASDAVAIMSGHVPYGIVLGNHDKRSDDGRPPAEFLDMVPPLGGGPNECPRLRFSPDGTPSTDNANTYQEFVAEGTRFGVLCLEFNPPNSTAIDADHQAINHQVRDWAADIARTHSSTMIICATHAYLGEDPTPKYVDPKAANPGTGPPARADDGTPNSAYKTIWEDVVRDHPNVFMVLCGHGGVDRDSRPNADGSVVYELMADYSGPTKRPPSELQGEVPANDVFNLGGWLRIMRFTASSVEVTTFSTTLGRYWCDSPGQQSQVGAHHPEIVGVAPCDSAHCFTLPLGRPVSRR